MNISVTGRRIIVVTSVKNKYDNKIAIRDSIEYHKLNFINTRSDEELLKAAVLKGLYMAVGGKKGIVLSPKADYIVFGTNIIFTYMYKLDTCKTPTGATSWLIQSNIDKHIINTIAMAGTKNNHLSNEEIAKLTSQVIFSSNIEDIVFNKITVYNVVLDILNRLGRR